MHVKLLEELLKRELITQSTPILIEDHKANVKALLKLEGFLNGFFLQNQNGRLEKKFNIRILTCVPQEQMGPLDDALKSLCKTKFPQSAGTVQREGNQITQKRKKVKDVFVDYLYFPVTCGIRWDFHSNHKVSAGSVKLQSPVLVNSNTCEIDQELTRTSNEILHFLGVDKVDWGFAVFPTKPITEGEPVFQYEQGDWKNPYYRRDLYNPEVVGEKLH